MTPGGSGRNLRDSGIVRWDRSSLREHLATSRHLLGVVPLNEVHFFMDASARRHGGGHQLIQHKAKPTRFMWEYYAGLDAELAHQAYLEVIG